MWVLIFSNKLPDYNLVYVPKHDEKKIWEELTFLSMIDSQDEEPKNGKKNYFFREEDIKIHVKSIEDYKNNIPLTSEFDHSTFFAQVQLRF